MKSAFPKIFAVGTQYIADLFKEDVEITEKLDGSQFGFGKFNGQLACRSKGMIQHIEAPDKMFEKAVEYVKTIENKLPEGVLFYAEYLQKPKHSTLTYDSVPKNNLALFGVRYDDDRFEDDYDKLKEWATRLDIDIVPIIFKGKINSADELLTMLETDSFLGGQKVEGVVVKRYKEWLFGGQIMHIMGGKFVSERFKEVHKKEWKYENTGSGKWEAIMQSYKTEARWNKAIMHLKERGEFTESPKDIGALMKEVREDLTIEEKENIKEQLWQLHSPQLLRVATAGLPEWYKEKLLKDNFNEGSIERSLE